MRTILLLVVSFPLLGQMFPFPGPGLPNLVPPVTTTSLVGQGHGSTSVGLTPLPVTTTSGTASSGGGTTLDVQVHDLVHMFVTINDGSTCWGSGVTVTGTDIATTPNTLTSLGNVTNGNDGNACVYSLWVDVATAKTGDVFSASLTSGWNLAQVNVLVFRQSTPPSSWSVVGHYEKDAGGGATATSNSIGNGVSQDVISAGGGNISGHSGTWTAGACANSTNCTLATTTFDGLSEMMYQILSASQTAATTTISTSNSAGLCSVSALFHPTP